MVSLKHERKVSQVIRELKALGIETTADLNLALVGRYIASRPDGQSAWTLKGHLQIIATICNMAVRARVLTVSPFATRPICKLVRTGPPEGKRHYSLDEIRRLLELLQADVNAKKGWPAWRARRLQAVAATAVYCGLRTTELLRLHAADLDFDRHVVRVVPRGSRGMGLKTNGAGKPVGMPLALEPILRSWLEWRLSAPAELAEKFPRPSRCRSCSLARSSDGSHGRAGRRERSPSTSLPPPADVRGSPTSRSTGCAVALPPQWKHSASVRP